jgi:hypothetical protein
MEPIIFLAMVVTTSSTPCVAKTSCWVGRARIGFLAAIKRDPWEATRSCSEVPATMECSAVEDPITWSAVRATTASVATLAPTA